MKKWLDKKVAIDVETLAKCLAKIRNKNDQCEICNSGLCVVCQAYALLDGKQFENLQEESKSPLKFPKVVCEVEKADSHYRLVRVEPHGYVVERFVRKDALGLGCWEPANSYATASVLQSAVEKRVLVWRDDDA